MSEVIDTNETKLTNNITETTETDEKITGDRTNSITSDRYNTLQSEEIITAGNTEGSGKAAVKSYTVESDNTTVVIDADGVKEVKERLNILVLEDNPIQCQTLQNTLEQISGFPNVITADNAHAAVKLLRNSLVKSKPFHLFLLDIHLSEDETKYEGFQFAKLVRSFAYYQMTPLFFLTSNRKQVEFALCNFHCYNYIKKPYSLNNVASQIEHALLASTMKMPDTYILLRDTNRIAHRVQKDCILYLASNGHAIDIVCVNEKVTTRDFNLTSLMGLLGNNFYRCHKKYIVNINMIDNFDFTCCRAELGEHVIPVGRTYKEELMENMPFL